MNKLIVSSSPHIREKNDTPRIMLDVIIALLPAVIAGAFIFGFKALLVVATCVLTAIVSEFLFNLITKREQTIFDFSAIITGMILGLSLHSNTPIWQCVVGTVFAIIVVKCLFGGLGANFANPAATARIFLLISFSSFEKNIIGGVNPGSPDLVTGATPLANIKNGGDLPTLVDMFFGNRGGAIGEVCIFALLIGFIYLVIRKVINFEVPLILVGTVFVLTLVTGGTLNDAMYQVLGGGLVFAAIFMATDYTTTPITRVGKMVFAFGVGLLTFLIRKYDSASEGVSYALVLMNILSPYVEKWTKPRALGKRGKKA